MIMETMLIILAAVWLARSLSPLAAPAQGAPPLARPVSPQLASALGYADRLFAEKKWLGAEKAYLNVLKLDHKNLTAYSHLGIIYTTQKNFNDAIECFELAVRYKPSAPTYQNLAMALYENRNFVKAIAMFDKAIMFEPNAQRYIGLSKAYKKMNNLPKMIEALEQAAVCEPTKRILDLLASGYADAGRIDDSRATLSRIQQLQTMHGRLVHPAAPGTKPAQP
jgi:tetratricopeptide (TPR) repeat protein